MRVHPTDCANLPALDVALLIAIGWVVEWPLEWTRSGSRAVRRSAHGARQWSYDELMAEARRAFTGSLTDKQSR